MGIPGLVDCRSGLLEEDLPFAPWCLSALGSLALLVAWVASVVAAVRLRDRTLVRLHLVVGAALVLGLVSISRSTFYFYFDSREAVLLALAARLADLVFEVSGSWLRRTTSASGDCHR